MNSRNTWLARQVPLCLIQLSTGRNALKVAVLSRVWHWTTCPPLVSLGLFIFVNVSDHIYSNIYRCRAHILPWAPDSVVPAPQSFGREHSCSTVLSSWIEMPGL